MFYRYDQNKFAGFYNRSKDFGVTEVVIIEADNVEEADSLARECGIYFSGFRWNSITEADALITLPTYRCTSVENADVCIHYKHGRVWGKLY